MEATPPWWGGDPDAWAARRLAFCKSVKAMGLSVVASLDCLLNSSGMYVSRPMSRAGQVGTVGGWQPADRPVLWTIMYMVACGTKLSSLEAMTNYGQEVAARYEATMVVHTPTHHLGFE